MWCWRDLSDARSPPRISSPRSNEPALWYFCLGNVLWNVFYHQVFLPDPAVSGKLLQHGDKVLYAAVPVTQEKDHHEQRQDTEEQTDHLQVCIWNLSRRDNKTTCYVFTLKRDWGPKYLEITKVKAQWLKRGCGWTMWLIWRQEKGLRWSGRQKPTWLKDLTVRNCDGGGSQDDLYMGTGWTFCQRLRALCCLTSHTKQSGLSK